MRGFGKLLLTNVRLFLREPISVFFTLAFAPLLVLLFGAMYGNEPSQYFGGRGSMDVTVPAYIGLILGSVGLLNIPINLSGQREFGILRRFQASPLRPLAYILADLISNLLVTLLGIILLLIAGKLLYDVQLEGSMILVGLAILIGSLAMFSIGYFIASIVPSARTGQVIGMVIFYPMMFISGAGMPLEILPATIQKIAHFLPLYYVVNLIKAMWFGEPVSSHLLDIGILAGITALGFGLASRMFKWK